MTRSDDVTPGAGPAAPAEPGDPVRRGGPTDRSARRGGPDGFARRKLLGLLSGTWVSQALYAVVKLGVPDLLAGGPRTADELAAASGADPRAVYRLLRALALMGLFRQTAERAFALTPVTELLRSDAPGSADLMAAMYGEEVFASFAEILYTARTGKPAFEKVYGTSFYAYLAGNPRAAAVFHTAMGGAEVPAALAACDLAAVGTVVDVGGGNGRTLAEILAAHPGMRGVLLELPDGVRHARTTLADAGVADRVELVEGSFFDGVPGGGDAYLLARVLHNWTDEHATEILRRVRAAMAPDARLIVCEEFLPEDGAAGGTSAAGLVDLLMLVTLEGHDRTEAEYRALVTGAGFVVRSAADTGRGPVSGLLEAVPA